MTGFLGAGKTTLINQLLNTKPTGARWALLINEFGRIGIDAALLKNSQSDDTGNDDDKEISISEVSGGCICCTSQLPLQIALTRLLSDHRPQRLIIEPTGLAHPRELLRQLSEPHWQTALSMQAVITVLSARQWQNEKYRQHDGFQAHVRAADIVIINRYEQLDQTCQQEIQHWIAHLNASAQIIWSPSLEEYENPNNTAVTSFIKKLTLCLNTPTQTIQHTEDSSSSRIRLQPLKPLLSSNTTAKSSDIAVTINADISANDELPYRYHDEHKDLFQQSISLGGWRLPAQWIFDAKRLQQWLLQLPNWQRIKGVINTSDGWLQLNFTPDSLSTTTTSAQVDSRLEIIMLSEKSQEKWAIWDSELMALII